MNSLKISVPIGGLTVGEEINVLAVDFGASNGRVMLSKFDGSKITTEEIYRFPNEPVKIGNRLYWDFLRLVHELKNGLRIAANKGIKIHSIGIDTWGVDYGLLDKNDELISNPIHYRDSRTTGVLEDVKNVIPLKEIYEITGVQFLELNTLFQLYVDSKTRKEILDQAETLLLMPDLFNFCLTGEKCNEYTIASTSQMLNAYERSWAYELIRKLGLPENILQPIVMPGTVIGHLEKEIQNEVGLIETLVVAVGTHDTASAVAGTPIEENSAYLSCGTWSLLGIESECPIINEKSYRYNFTNEGGVGGKIRFLKNINGLWIIQELKKSLEKRGVNLDFPQISELAAEARNAHFTINPGDKLFLFPSDMVEAIQKYCLQTGQGKPEEVGELARAAYNGLTKQYKETIECIEEITGKRIETINLVGGGVRDKFHCELTAIVTGRKVIAGPIEAAVLGNTIVQLIALGYVNNLEEGRKIIKNSFAQEEYLPTN